MENNEDNIKKKKIKKKKSENKENKENIEKNHHFQKKWKEKKNMKFIMNYQ